MKGGIIVTPEHHKDSNSGQWLSVNYSLLLNNSTMVIAKTTGQQTEVNITPITFSRVKGREWYRIAAIIKPVSDNAISEYHIKKE
jgi:hypothetical protein